MTAVAGFGFYPVLRGILAGLTAVLLGLHFRGEDAVALLVRAFDRLVHDGLFPAYGLFSTSPPTIWEEGLGALGTTGGSP